MNEVLMTGRGSVPVVNESVFLGEIDLISYADISTLSGVTQGTLHNEGSGWLRFDYGGTELIISKKTIRYNITWDHIHAQGCVFGSKIITINGSQYKVRLLKGADHNPTQLTLEYGYFIEGSHNSEWSRLFYPLITDDSTLNDLYTGPKDPRYTNADLGVVNTENGRYSWCQETHQDHASYRVVRSGYGVSYLYRYYSSLSNASYGWRPVLELIS